VEEKVETVAGYMDEETDKGMVMAKEVATVKKTEQTKTREQEKQQENDQLVQRGQQWGQHWGACKNVTVK
jgi:SOS response regulatory protein OraA/RecX